MLAHYEPNSVAGAGRGIASRNTAHHTTAKHRITSWTVPGNLFAVCTHRVSATFIWELGNFHMGSRRLSYGILAAFTWNLGDFRLESWRLSQGNSATFAWDLGDFRIGSRRLSRRAHGGSKVEDVVQHSSPSVPGIRAISPSERGRDLSENFRRDVESSDAGGVLPCTAQAHTGYTIRLITSKHLIVSLFIYRYV